MKTIWIISGEASGDNYGARLITALKNREPDCRILAMGGGKMRSAGAEIVVDSTELGVVGISETFRKLFFFIRLLKELSRKIVESRPSAVVLIDYPGLNLRLAQRLHKAGIRVIWYVSPQVWAWKAGRIPKLAACVDKMICIFPFEPAVYEGSGLPTVFLGHPLLEILAPLRHAVFEKDPNLVILLPGSRAGELHRLLGVCLESAIALKRQRPELHFVMPLQRERNLQMVRKLMENMPFARELEGSLEITVGNAREWMCRAAAGIAASGTVTVEAAILGLPLVVIYKVNWLSWQVAKWLVKVKYVSIANITMNESIYKERLQQRATVEEIVPQVMKLLPGGERREEVLDKLKEFVDRLGGEAPVSDRIAQCVLEMTR